MVSKMHCLWSKRACLLPAASSLSYPRCLSASPPPPLPVPPPGCLHASPVRGVALLVICSASLAHHARMWLLPLLVTASSSCHRLRVHALCPSSHRPTVLSQRPHRLRLRMRRTKTDAPPTSRSCVRLSGRRCIIVSLHGTCGEVVTASECCAACRPVRRRRMNDAGV